MPRVRSCASALVSGERVRGLAVVWPLSVSYSSSRKSKSDTGHPKMCIHEACDLEHVSEVPSGSESWPSAPILDLLGGLPGWSLSSSEPTLLKLEQRTMASDKQAFLGIRRLSQKELAHVKGGVMPEAFGCGQYYNGANRPYGVGDKSPTGCIAINSGCSGENIRWDCSAIQNTNMA